MRLNRWVLWVGVVLVALGATLAFSVKVLVPRWLVPSLTAAVQAETGRALRMGDAVVTLWPRPAIVVSDVRLANAPWSAQPWLAQLGQARAELDLRALLSGQLRISQITVNQATVLVETDAHGAGNWVMAAPHAAQPTGPGVLPFDALTLHALAVTYRNGQTGQATAGALDKVKLAVGAAPHALQLSAHATVHGQRAQVLGTLGSLAAWRENAPWPIDLQAQIGAATMHVRGHIGQPQTLDGLRLALQAQTPDLAALAALWGAKVPSLGPWRAAATLSGSAAAPVFIGIDVVGGSPKQMGLTARGEVTGMRSAAGSYAWRSSGIDLRLEGVQLGDLAPWFDVPLPAWGSYRIAARVDGTLAEPALSSIDVALGGGPDMGGKALPQITLRGTVTDLRTLSGMDVRLTASASEWWQTGHATNHQHVPPFQASARLRGAPERVRVDDLTLKVADSVVRASLQVVRGGPRWRITGKVASPLIDLARPRSADRGAAAVGGAAVAFSGNAVEANSALFLRDLWAWVDVDLDVQVSRFIFPGGRELRSGSGRVGLGNGRLNVRAVRATLGGAQVKLDGHIANPAQLAGIDVRMTLHGHELAELFRFIGAPLPQLPPVGPYGGSVRLQGAVAGLQLTEIDAAVGPSGQRVHATGQIDNVLRQPTPALAITADVRDSVALGRLFGTAWPRLPAWHATARLSGASARYAVDDLHLTLGRSAVQGRVVWAPGVQRPLVMAQLSGALLDLSELPFAQSFSAAQGATQERIAVPQTGAAPARRIGFDVDANLRFDRVVLPQRRALGPVSGAVRLADGVLDVNKFSLALDGASLTLDGTVRDLRRPEAMALALNADVKRGTGLSTFTGLNLQSLPAFTASAQLTGTPGGFALAGLKLVNPAATLAGEVAVMRGTKRYKVSAKIHSSLFDASVLQSATAAGRAAKPTGAGTGAAADARVFADLPLPLDALRAIDAEFDLRIDRVKFANASPLGPLWVQAQLVDGRLKAEPMQLGSPESGFLRASASVDAAQAAWALRAQAQGLDLGLMLARLGHSGVVSGGQTAFAVQVRGRGKTLHALLGTLEGQARLEIGPLRVHNMAIALDRGLIAGIVDLAIPFHKTDPNTDFTCVVARVPIDKGVLTFDRSIAAESTNYNLVLSGMLNLRTEVIDFGVLPLAKGPRGVGSASVTKVVRVGGTLSDPALGVNPIGVAKSAVEVGVAVMAPPLWLADAMLKKMRSDPHPCATVLAK